MQDSEFIELILHAFPLDDLKTLCRDYNLKGFSRFKKSELVPFIKTSLAEEELTKMLSIKGQEVIEKTIDLAVAIATGKEIREKLREVTDAGGVITLEFKGLQWTQTTTVKDPSKGDMLPTWTCTCRNAQDGGICTHFYIAAVSLSQLHGWPLTSIPKILWPSGCEEKFNTFQAKSFLVAGEGALVQFNTVDDILRGFFLDYGSNDATALERRSKGELFDLIKTIDRDYIFEENWTKSRIVGGLVEKLGKQELEARFRKARQDQKYEMAENYLVDIKDVEWEPKEMVVANLQRMESHDIVVKDTKVTHECDGWRNIRPKFCNHLLALFLELSRREPDRTLKWLKKLAKT